MTPRSRVDADPQAEATMEALRRQFQQPPPKRFGWLWLLVAVFAGYLFAHLGGRSAPDQVERAVPGPSPVVRDYAPRAELVQRDFAPRPVGGAFDIQMPDGRRIHATVRSAVGSPHDLPLSANNLGDARYVAGDKHWYIWTIGSASAVPTWIDP